MKKIFPKHSISFSISLFAALILALALSTYGFATDSKDLLEGAWKLDTVLDVDLEDLGDFDIFIEFSDGTGSIFTPQGLDFIEFGGLLSYLTFNYALTFEKGKEVLSLSNPQGVAWEELLSQECIEVLALAIEEFNALLWAYLTVDEEVLTLNHQSEDANITVGFSRSPASSYPQYHEMKTQSYLKAVDWSQQNLIELLGEGLCQ